MNIVIREDLRELASHWAHVLAEDLRLSGEGMDRVLACVREETEALIARRLPEHGHGPIRPRGRPRKRQPDTTIEAAERFLDGFGARVVSDE